jgi:hypothetical protein
MSSNPRYGCDSDSGQVFTEWIEKRLNLADLDWHRRLPSSNSPLKHKTSKRGARPLMDMCIDLLVSNIDGIDVDTIQNVPDELLWRLLHIIKLKSKQASFQTWKLFMTRLSGPDDPRYDELTTFLTVITLPRAPLDAYVQPMISTSFSFLVDLTIAEGANFQVQELHRLIDLVNLRTLRFITPDNVAPRIKDTTFPQVSDRLIRHWSDVKGAFPKLVALHIVGCSLTTCNSLPYLARFPALEVLHVNGSVEHWPLKSPQMNLSEWTCRTHPLDRHETSQRLATTYLGDKQKATLRSSWLLELFFHRTRSQPSIDVVNEDLQPRNDRLGRPKRTLGATSVPAKRLKGAANLLADFGM